MRSRLRTTAMGLGLVRLLQDAGRTKEARTTLYSLENDFQGIETDKPSQECNPWADELGLALVTAAGV
jgi:hypothetical protein